MVPLFLLLLSPAVSVLAATIGEIGPLPSDWEYVGCLVDGRVGERYLNETWFGSDDMTPNYCAQYCGNQGFSLAAIEEGYQCFCGSKLSVVQQVSESRCDWECDGDFDLVCGGPGWFTFLAVKGSSPLASKATTSRSSSTTRSTTTSQVKATTTTTTITNSPASSTSANVVLPPSQQDSALPTSQQSTSLSGASTMSASSSSASSRILSDKTSKSGTSSTASKSSPPVLDLYTANSTTGSGSSATGTSQKHLPQLADGKAIQSQGNPRFRDESENVVFGQVSGAGRRRVSWGLIGVTILGSHLF